MVELPSSYKAKESMFPNVLLAVQLMYSLFQLQRKQQVLYLPVSSVVTLERVMNVKIVSISGKHLCKPSFKQYNHSFHNIK